MTKSICFTFLIFYTAFCFSQTNTGSLFKKNDRVCFVGNSITDIGGFHHNILLYHVTRFPDQPLSFFNCGISGDETGAILNRIDTDILIHQPTHVVIMAGMNDVQIYLYVPWVTSNADTLQQRRNAIDIYKVNYEKIINIFLSKNVKVILEKPTIYDQTAVLPAYNSFGVNDALKICADFIGDMAVKYNLPVVDYWTIMNNINKEMQQKDPSATITGPDRVHPTSPGFLVMAYQFLKSEKVPQYVSKIIIGKSITESSKKNLNCEFNSFKKICGGISFSVKEMALPFPVIDDQPDGLKLVPFESELNLELLQAPDLKSGQYQLTIDDKMIGTFSDAQFKEGINLADFSETPQYKQAMEVRDKLTKLWNLEANLRTIHFIEYDPYFKTCPDKDNLYAAKTYLDSVFTLKYGSQSYIKAQLEKYLSVKPKEKEFETECDILRKEAFQVAQTKEHRFLILHQPTDK
jgi:endoglucanase